MSVIAWALAWFRRPLTPLHGPPAPSQRPPKDAPPRARQ